MSRSKAQPRPRLPSLLPGWLRRLLAGAIVVAGFLLADTVYLLLVRFASGVGLTPFALGADTLPRFYQFMLLAHTGVGIALVGVMIVFLVAHLPTVWRRYHAASAWSGGAYAVLGITLLVTGLFILSAAATRENQWAWWTHVVASSVVVGAYIVHRMVSFARPDGLQFARYLGGISVAALALFLAHGALVLGGGGTLAAPSTAPGGADRDVQQLLAGRFGPAGCRGAACQPVLPLCHDHHDRRVSGRENLDYSGFWDVAGCSTRGSGRSRFRDGGAHRRRVLRDLPSGRGRSVGDLGAPFCFVQQPLLRSDHHGYAQRRT